MARTDDEPRVSAGKGRPHVCLVCKAKPGQYYGRLVFENESDPSCPNHKTPQPLIPA